MSRVDELQKKYPTLAREILAKWEVLRYGIRDSDAVYKNGFWIRAAGGYHSLDHGVKLDQIKQERPDAVRPGYVFLPGVFYMKNGIGARIERDVTSPYLIRENKEGEYALYEGEDKVEDVYFSGPRPWGDQFFTSKGTPATSLVTTRGRCFALAPLRYCEFFDKGEDCKFCNYNFTHHETRSLGGKHAITTDMDDMVEAYKILASEVRFVEGRYQSGAISDSEKEASLQIKSVERIATAVNYTPNLSMSTPPMSRKNMQRLKDAGLNCVNMNVEVWTPEIFAEVCPGKSKYRGWEGYMEAYLDARDVFGPGNAGSNFVGGVSMFAANGHKTWQESRDSLIEGMRWLLKNGLYATVHAIRLGAGSIYGEDPANEAKLPPTEYFLDAGLAHHQACMEYNTFETYNKLFFCPLDCIQTLYAGEISMIELAGDVGKWAAQAVPEEANWLSRFINKLEPAAQPWEHAK